MKSFLFILLVFTLSCSTIKVEHISKVKKFDKNHLVYFLPLTKIEVIFEIKEILYKPGPFAAYAKKYLGYDNIGTKEKKTYILNNVYAITKNIVDSSNLYVCFYKNLPPSLYNFFQSTHNKIENNNELNFLNNFKPFYFNEIYLTRGKETIYYKKIDTSYKTILIDSILKKMPVIKIKIDSLNTEEQALEASNHIFDLRKKRYELFSGDLEYVPQGEAAKYIYDILNNEEIEYLSLFIGKHYVRELKYSIEIIPFVKPYKEIVGFFSEKYGFSTAQTVLSEPIYVKILPEASFLSYYNQFANVKLKKKNNKTIPIRFPLPATLLIYSDDSELLYKKDILINQWGIIQNIPFRTLKEYLNSNLK
ncbi:MAG: DUF4831 family protein [Bacteroidales bacterium]|nr:DUF4831 family protein [Bacteroidales bacterium]